MISSVREIARKSGFSVAAVSKTLNAVEGTIRIGSETRQKILETARKLRYRPNNDIGLLVTPDFSYLDPLTARVLQGVQSEAQRRNSHVLCGLLADGEIPDLVRESCVGGMLLLHHAPQAVTDILEEKGLPYIVINPNVDKQNDCVLCDDGDGMLQALNHLHSRECRRFVFIWPKNDHPSYEKRRRAFVEFGADRKLECTHFDSLAAASAEKISKVMDHPQSTGFIILEEMTPFLLSIGGSELGKRMQIVTINDLISARFIPQITSVRIPFLEMGREAVRMIARKWEQGRPLPSTLLKPELMNRD